MDKLYLFISSDCDPCTFNQELEIAFNILKSSSSDTAEVPILKAVGLNPVKEDQASTEAISVGYDFEEKFTSNFVPYRDGEENCDIEQKFTKISEKLHGLLDEVIVPGRTQLFAFWVANLIPDPNDILEFYGVLERLQAWCNGKLEIIATLSDQCENWKNLLQIGVYESCTEAMEKSLQTLWAGSLLDYNEEEPGSSVGPNICLQNASKSFTAFVAPLSQCTETFVLPTAEIFGEVHIASVPWLSIVPEGNCQLSLLSKDSMVSHSILSNIYQKTDVGVLLRIRFSMQPLIPKSPKNLCSKSWKQNICDGPPLTSPVFSFKGAHHTQVFLLVSEGSTAKHMTAISLQDLNNYSGDIIDSFLQPNIPTAEEDSFNLSLKLFKETPLYSPLFMRALSFLVDEVPHMFAKQVAAKGHDIQQYKPETKEQIECLFSSSYFTHLFMTKQKFAEVLPPPEEQIETFPNKENWPTYQALLNYEKRKKMNPSPSKLSRLSRSTAPLIPLVASEISKCFTRKGEPSESHQKKMVKLEARRSRHFDSKDECLTKNWPDCLNSTYHGIHYHIGTGNEVSEGFIMSHEQHVQNETDSVCSVFRKSETYVNGTDKVKNKAKSKASTSKMCVTPSKSKVARQMVFDSPSRNLRSSKDSSKLSSPSRSQLRRSPRKKIQQNAYNSSKVRSSPRSLQRQMSSPSKLSSLHTQKLRNAVMNALEGEQITLKNSIFKNCFKKLFAVCKPFAIDIIGMGSTSRNMEKIAKSHVTQVIEFEMRKSRK